MHISYLIGKLDDELDLMISLKVASHLLTDALAKSQSELSEYFTEWQPTSRKYWTVPQEIGHENLEHIAGLAFVIAHVALTQTISIIRFIRQSCDRPLAQPKKT